jgi:D-3-phosphoglycerate dehydrogenase / 2-oxoglutarate reductase
MEILNIEPHRYDDYSRILLQKIGVVDFINIITYDELIEVASEKSYEAIFVKLGIPIDKGIIDAMPSLKYIITPTTGLNHIDLGIAKSKGIKVISLKGETEFLKTVKSTAEHTWMLLLALIRKLPHAFDDVKNYNWRREPFLGSEVGGKTLGIIGYGRLGKIVANYAVAFGANVIVNDIDEQKLNYLPAEITSVSLHELLGKSEIISIHIPSNNSNYQFVSSDLICQMKKGAILVNTSRGEVVDENAIMIALNSNQLAGYAADVMDGDSSWEGKISRIHPLVEFARRNNNLIITPHIGGYALESIKSTRYYISKKFSHILKLQSH